jgi:hypothetical protein
MTKMRVRSQPTGTYGTDATSAGQEDDGSTRALGVDDGVDDDSEAVGEAVAELVGAGPVVERNQNGAAAATTKMAASPTTVALRTHRRPASVPNRGPNRDPLRARAFATTRSTPATARPESAGVKVA